MKNLLLIFGLILMASNARAARACKAYKVYSKSLYAKQESLAGYVNEHGVSINTNGKSNPEYLRCFVNNKFKYTVKGSGSGMYGRRSYTVDIRCQCVAHSGINEGHLANLIANKISVKMNKENSKNIEKTVTKTFLLHSELVLLLKSFVSEILDLQK